MYCLIWPSVHPRTRWGRHPACKSALNQEGVTRELCNTRKAFCIASSQGKTGEQPALSPFPLELEGKNAASHLLQVLGAEGEGQELIQCLDDVGAVGFGQVDIPVLAELQEERGKRCPMPKLHPPGGCARVAPIICLGAAPGGYLGLRACISPPRPKAGAPKTRLTPTTHGDGGMGALLL